MHIYSNNVIIVLSQFQNAFYTGSDISSEQLQKAGQNLDLSENKSHNINLLQCDTKGMTEDLVKFIMSKFHYFS